MDSRKRGAFKLKYAGRKITIKIRVQSKEIENRKIIFKLLKQ